MGKTEMLKKVPDPFFTHTLLGDKHRQDYSKYDEDPDTEGVQVSKEWLRHEGGEKGAIDKIEELDLGECRGARNKAQDDYER